MKYYIKTFGCQMNFSDSERVAGFLEKKKFKPAKEIDQAELVVFNTCGVRQTAENSAMGQIHNLRKKNSSVAIVLTGCLSERKDVQKKLNEKVDLFFPINDFLKFENYLIKNQKFKILNKKNKKLKYSKETKRKNQASYLSIKPKYENKLTAYVPIMTGCNNFCSYCVVPYARGREISRPLKEIFSEIADLGKNGQKEIILLGQNVNSYSYKLEKEISKLKNLKIKKLIENYKFEIENSITINFPLLLNLLASSRPTIQFRFLTSHPKDFSDDLIEVIAQNRNISREIHLPFQAGSNKILKRMNRPYNQEYYLKLIEKIKKAIPGAKISTDVIVGFPGETKKDFQETVKIFKEVGFFLAYINKYSPRPGTKAFSLKDNISWNEKKVREKILRKLTEKYKQKNISKA